MVDDPQLDALAGQLADQALVTQLRPNALTRYATRHHGPIAGAAELAGAVAATGALYRRVVRQARPDSIVRSYAADVGVDYDRAHADVSYVGHRLRFLALASADQHNSTAGTDDDALVHDAARVLVAFVASGRDPDHRLDDVEAAFGPLREAIHDSRPQDETHGLLRSYRDAWRRAVIGDASQS